MYLWGLYLKKVNSSVNVGICSVLVNYSIHVQYIDNLLIVENVSLVAGNLWLGCSSWLKIDDMEAHLRFTNRTTFQQRFINNDHGFPHSSLKCIFHNSMGFQSGCMVGADQWEL